MPMKKTVIIGSGNVGITTAHYIAQTGLTDVVVVDIVKGMPQAKAYDYTLSGHSGSGTHGRIHGTNNMADIANADVIVHTAGIARKPGISRMDLLHTNIGIARDAATAITQHAPNATILVVANPLDIIAMAMYMYTGFPKHRIIGMAGVLDSARYRSFIAEKLGVHASDTQAMVLGGHGDSMVPLAGATSVAGMPIHSFTSITQEDISAMAERTQKGGAEIVSLLKTGSAYYAPAAAAAKMCRALLGREKSVVPASVLLEGEYGFHNLFLGVPVIISAKGIERIIQIPLSDAEKTSLEHSAKEVHAGVELLKTLIN